MPVSSYAVGEFHVTCERDFYKLGCFMDKRWERTMPNLLITDRDISSPHSHLKSIDWNNWNEYIHRSVLLIITVKKKHVHIILKKTGSHQCIRAVCSIFAGIHSTLTPRYIDSSPPVQSPVHVLSACRSFETKDY